MAHYLKIVVSDLYYQRNNPYESELYISSLVCLKLKDINKTLLVYDLENQQYLVCQKVRPLVFEPVP
jgi:hypothetical protein